MDDLNRSGVKPIITETISVPVSKQKQVKPQITAPAVPVPVAVEIVAKPNATPSKAELVAAVKEDLAKEPVAAPKVAEEASSKPTQSAKAETKADETDASKAKTEREAARWAALTQKEKFLTDKEKEYKQKDIQYKALETELKSIKGNPANAIKMLEKEFGITFESMLDHFLTNGKLTPEQEIAQIKKEREEERQLQARQAEESNTKAMENNLNTFKADLKTFIDGNNEAYELIQANEAYDLVFNVIDQDYRKSGQIMKTEDAAKLVEDYLLEKAKKLMQAKKLSKTEIEAESKGEIEVKEKEEVRAKRNQVMPQRAIEVVSKPNLTNLKNVTVANPSSQAQTKKERYARAIAAFNNASKK